MAEFGAGGTLGLCALLVLAQEPFSKQCLQPR